MVVYIVVFALGTSQESQPSLCLISPYLILPHPISCPFTSPDVGIVRALT